MGQTIEEAFNRLELLVKVAKLCVKLPNPKTPSCSHYLNTLRLIDSSDEFYSVENEPIYEQINSFSKRAYDHVPAERVFEPQHLVACEHLFSIRDEHDPHVVHHNRIGCCPPLWKKGAVSSRRANGRVALHQAMSGLLGFDLTTSFCGFPEIGCIFDCVSSFASLLMLRGIRITAT